MKYFYLSFLFAITCSVVNAQQSMVWKETDQSATFNEVMLLENPRYITVNLAELSNLASAAPMEFTDASRNSNIKINLPLPDGTSQNFYLVESPVMHPNLAAKFPELKSYTGYSADERFGSLRFSQSPQGITAIIKNSLGISYIQYVDGAPGLHQCFARNDMDFESIYQMVPELSCGYDPSTIEADEPYEHDHDHDHLTANERSISAEVSELKVYEMALACTGEYGQAKGGTVPSVMASFNEAMTILNSVLQEEHGLKFELVENNDILINLDPSTDFFTSANQGTALLQQNQNYLNSVIGNNNFDIGHIFTMSCTDVAGVVSGRACNNPNKGRGVTCHYSSIINVVSETMSHEVAHQFAAGHTWANCPNIMDQLASASAYEPGSGSTIMSYLGSCGSENIIEGFNQNNRYYHVKTLEEVELFSTAAIGASCPDFIPTDNHHPEVSHNHGGGFYIPTRTPFELEAVASDVDGDQLSYCWEQYDLGPTSTLSADQISGSTSPLFMSVSPTDDNIRVFPKLNRILTGNYTLSERLPTVGRELNFKCTVRDGDPEAGGWNTTQVSFNVAENAGPFSVTYPSASNHTLEGGDQVTITWDPANSNAAPVNCYAVDIYLSTTGGNGNAFTLLASSVPNTGSYTTFLPNVSTFAGRIKIKASESIFFDISNANFTITQPTDGFFSFAPVSDVYQFACLPEDLLYSFEYKGYNDFETPLELTLVSDLPDGLNLDWETLTMNTGETADLNVTFDDSYANQLAELQFRGIVDQDTFFQTIYVDAENADFSALELLEPFNALTQQPLAMNYSWVDVPNSELYDIQIATNPSFEEEYIIDEEYNTPDAFYNSNEPLNKGQVYFWRVRGSTPRCGKGEWRGPFYFQTFTESCKTFVPGALPLNISSQLSAGSSVVSEIAAVDNSIISDINIANLEVTHDKLKDIKIFVQSPTGTEVVLHDGTCVLTEMNLSFDDESLAPIPCPANTNELVQPIGSLSDFDGEDLIGIWKLYIEVLDNIGAGGQLKNWELESCGAFVPNSPYLVTNEILTVRDGKGRLIQNDVLQVADEDNTPEELIFTITQAPQHGQLLWSGDADGVNVGDFFKQISIDLNHVEYLHSGNGENDSFKFIVTDGTGGLLQETTVIIQLDPDAPTSTDPSIENNGDWRISPNPSNGNFMLNLEGNWTKDLKEIKIFDVEGKLVHNESIQYGIRSKSMRLNHLRNGAYSIQLIGKDVVDTKRFIITK